MVHGYQWLLTSNTYTQSFLLDINVGIWDFGLSALFGYKRVCIIASVFKQPVPVLNIAINYADLIIMRIATLVAIMLWSMYVTPM